MNSESSYIIENPIKYKINYIYESEDGPLIAESNQNIDKDLLAMQSATIKELKERINQLKSVVKRQGKLLSKKNKRIKEINDKIRKTERKKKKAVEMKEEGSEKKEETVYGPRKK